MRSLILRALKAPESRHAVFRYRLNHLIASVYLDTMPKVMRCMFPGVRYVQHNQERYTEIGNEGSQIWFAGLDDKDRTEKILGMEFASEFFNECSQIPVPSVNTALTRLAQKATQKIKGIQDRPLKLRAYYDCNPPTKTHWTYRQFVEKRDPVERKPIARPDDYAWAKISPSDNAENLSPEYLQQLEALPPRMRTRYLVGDFQDDNPDALFPQEVIDTWRHIDGKLPDMVRVVVAVDPSGADDDANADNNAIGIAVVGLGQDGNAYLLEDCTVKAGPATWGRVATSAFERYSADCVVGETNYGGAMVGMVIQSVRPRTPFKKVTASRGKVQRAEPFSALYSSGKVRHVGMFPELEDELNAFAKNGYLGTGSPNRADALIWALAELFPAIVRGSEQRDAPSILMPVASPFRRR
jgi:hypothetical protein